MANEKHDPNEQQDIETRAIRVFQALMAGQQGQQADMDVLTGDVRACAEAMANALRLDGVTAVHNVFFALVQDRPWLGRLVSEDPPGPEQARKQASTSRQADGPRIHFEDDHVYESRPRREWLIPQVMPRQAVVMVFGQPGCGKSFLTINWALCIASGLPWLARQVLQGPVAYISAEGGSGLGPRIKAWKLHMGFSGNSGVKWYDASVLLNNTAELGELIAAIERDFGEPPVLIIIDTLSRCSAGADENSNTEMAKVIGAADILQKRFGGSVLIVHHSGKNRDNGPRGASVLSGNVETIIEVDRTSEGCKVTCYKQKDAPAFDTLHLQLRPTHYGPEEEDASAVLIYGNEKARPTFSRAEAVMYTALQGKQLTHTTWVEAGMGGEEKVITQGSAKAAIKKLVDSRRVRKVGKLYSHTTEGEGEDTDAPPSI